jgi:hypothetical protein
MFKQSSTAVGWPELLVYAEEKLRRSRLKVAQLDAIVKNIRKKVKSREPFPINVAVRQDRRKRKQLK